MSKIRVRVSVKVESTVLYDYRKVGCTTMPSSPGMRRQNTIQALSVRQVVNVDIVANTTIISIQRSSLFYYY